jgi:hypothetical protein
MSVASPRRDSKSERTKVIARTLIRWFALGALGAALGACEGDDTTAGNGVPSPDAGQGDGSTSPTMDSSITPDISTGNESDAGADVSLASDGSVSDVATQRDGSQGDAAPPANPCSALPGRIVYIESGDTQENLLKNLGRHLRDSANITLAFTLTGSCTLTADAYAGSKIAANTTLLYVPSTAENAAWTPAQPEATCVTSADGAPIDVAISALFVQSCNLGGPPAGSGLALLQGPIQAYTFVVPTSSDQTAIWAEEAYYAFGFGAMNPLAPTYNPWNMEQLMFIRPATKSTLVATAKNIAVPPNKWKGMTLNASSDVVNAVTNANSSAATAEPAIGILGAEVYDANRGRGLKTLAFQAFGQSAAYYPDSTSTAFDKQNLRDGHYTLWSPTVYITKVDGNDVPIDPAVKYIMDLVLGNPGATVPDGLAPEGAAPIDGLADVVKVGLIPQCAMQVTRSEDGGDLSLYTPAEPCTCYYLSHIVGATGTPTSCMACAEDVDCGDGAAACIHGYCEPNAAEERVPVPDGGAGCFGGTPTTHSEIINVCTAAQGIAKDVVLPVTDGGLRPIP